MSNNDLVVFGLVQNAIRWQSVASSSTYLLTEGQRVKVNSLPPRFYACRNVEIVYLSDVFTMDAHPEAYRRAHYASLASHEPVLIGCSVSRSLNMEDLPILSLIGIAE